MYHPATAAATTTNSKMSMVLICTSRAFGVRATLAPSAPRCQTREALPMMVRESPRGAVFSRLALRKVFSETAKRLFEEVALVRRIGVRVGRRRRGRAAAVAEHRVER